MIIKSITYVCDRCNLTVTQGSQGACDWRFVRHGYVRTVGKRMLLCPGCYDAFEVFMKKDTPSLPQPTSIGGEVPYAHR